MPTAQYLNNCLFCLCFLLDGVGCTQKSGVKCSLRLVVSTIVHSKCHTFSLQPSHSKLATQWAFISPTISATEYYFARYGKGITCRGHITSCSKFREVFLHVLSKWWDETKLFFIVFRFDSGSPALNGARGALLTPWI